MGAPVRAELSLACLGGSGNVGLYLSEHEGDRRPDTLIHHYVRDIDAVSDEFGMPVMKMASPDGDATSWTLAGNGLRVAHPALVTTCRREHGSIVRARTTAAADSAECPYGRGMRLSVLTLLMMSLVGALLWLRGAPGEGAALIAAAVPLAWWSNRRRCDTPS